MKLKERTTKSKLNEIYKAKRKNNTITITRDL